MAGASNQDSPGPGLLPPSNIDVPVKPHQIDELVDGMQHPLLDKMLPKK